MKLTIAATAALAVTAVALAPPAQARSYAHTTITWGGTNCIQTQGAMIANPYLLSVPTFQCSLSHSLVWDEVGQPGQWIGMDPIMGNADWIACSINDGFRTYTDFAVAGDGTDVTCLRVAL